MDESKFKFGSKSAFRLSSGEIVFENFSEYVDRRLNAHHADMAQREKQIAFDMLQFVRNFNRQER